MRTEGSDKRCVVCSHAAAHAVMYPLNYLPANRVIFRYAAPVVATWSAAAERWLACVYRDGVMSPVSPRSCADGVHWYAKAWQKLYETAVQVIGGH